MSQDESTCLDLGSSIESDDPIPLKSLTAAEAARHLSDVLDAVESGETFLIVRHGRVVAGIAPPAAGTGKAAKELLRRAP
jgi:prevent-host-death family protein